MDNTLIFLSGFCVGLFIYWLLWGPKKKKVNGQEYAFWELGSPFVTCSNCGQKAFDEVDYCPNCGLRMLGSKRVYQDPEDIGTTWEQLCQNSHKG